MPSLSESGAAPHADRSMPAGLNAAFIDAGGQMAALIDSHDWSGSALGPNTTWPQSLNTILRVLVTSRYAMWMGWGPELTFFYNDAYAPTLGVKHPWALGQPASRVWEEIWADIGPRAETVIRTGQATWDEGLLLFLERRGFPEETYHTFSYSPLPDDRGTVGGMLCVVAEETDRIIGQRRLATLRDLGSRLAASPTEAEVLSAIAEGLGGNVHDLPFTLCYLFDSEGDVARLGCQSGGALGDISPPMVDGDASGTWPAERILASQQPVLVESLEPFGTIPCGAWDQPPRQAIAVPILQQGQARPAGMFVAGLNPYRPFDEAYAAFIDLIAAQIGAGLASARAFESERRRAEALAEIDRAKTTFFSNVSHEFRTPLTLLLGPIEQALAESRGPEAERMAIAHRNALRLLRLVNTLLDFSRIEAGRVTARFQPTDLAAYTAELASNFRSACERVGLALTVDCPQLPQPIYIDADMWERIVLNLLSNAFKYTWDGGIEISIAAEPDAAVLRVKDTGVGIPAAELPRIFDRFHRIEGPRGRTMEGTGIGLALVHELVRLHCGTIDVTSEVDQGTIVSIRLPFGRLHLPADAISEDLGRSQPQDVTTAAFVEEALRWLPGSDQESEDLDHLPGSARTLASLGEPAAAAEKRLILLADDNADMRDYVARLLRRDYRVTVTADGEAALRAARRERPDLILSDVMMPRLDGLGLLAAVRADAALRDRPVILLSARAGEEARAEGLEAGADDYLVKPFSGRELLTRVRSALELATLRREAAEILRQANEQLEERVASEVRERMQVEAALRQSQKMEAVGHLTGGVAHDFNNLLTVITGGAETLQRLLVTQGGTAEPRAARALAMILQGAQRATTLTQRLLAFARRQTLDPKPIDLNKLVAGMSELLRRTLGESIAIETVLAGGLWSTLADPNQLESALLNLAVNARDAMPQGGRLTIETANTYLDDVYAAHHQEVQPGQYVMVAVSDTGIGMDHETMERVFEPFFTTKDIGQGTGLGLSQVYGFIKQSQGHVKLYSEVGQGTVVKLYLPRLAREQDVVAEPTPAGALPNGAGEVILVVEDDPDVREHSVETLRELGYRVLAAANGAQGLLLLERNPSVVLLFTDVGLPGGMNGRQLADAARRLRPDLQVLYTTGYARNAISHGGLLDPGTQVLPKPFTYADLAARIRKMLESHNDSSD